MGEGPAVLIDPEPFRLGQDHEPVFEGLAQQEEIATLAAEKAFDAPSREITEAAGFEIVETGKVHTGLVASNTALESNGPFPQDTFQGSFGGVPGFVDREFGFLGAVFQLDDNFRGADSQARRRAQNTRERETASPPPSAASTIPDELEHISNQIRAIRSEINRLARRIESVRRLALRAIREAREEEEPQIVIFPQV